MVREDESVRISVPGYEEFEPLGSGGFSRVWRAYQPRFRRSVAMKVLNFDIVDERAIQSFERECQAMGQVSVHPNIVTILDSGLTPDDRPFIVMDYFAGGTYADRAVGQDLPIGDLLRLGVKLCSALQAAHDAGILHRDIKPQNIFISKFNEPALGDFGISTIDQERTATGAAGFTVHYAAPEVLDGQPGTGQSDLYSLGATLYRLIEGERPFDGADQSVVATALRVIKEPVPIISRQDCPFELRDLVALLMNKSADARPPSPEDVAYTLQEIQRSLSLPVTEIARETQPEALTGMRPQNGSFDTRSTPTIARATEGIATESTTNMTVVRPSARVAVPVQVPDEGGRADRSQSVGWKWVAAGVGGVALLFALGVSAAMLGTDDPTTIPVSPPGFQQEDDLFDQPVTPSSVEATVAEDGTMRVTWSEFGNREGDIFRVTAIVDDASQDTVIEVTSTPAEFIGLLAENACFEVAMIRGGRISPPSPRVCVVP